MKSTEKLSFCNSIPPASVLKNVSASLNVDNEENNADCWSHSEQRGGTAEARQSPLHDRGIIKVLREIFRKAAAVLTEASATITQASITSYMQCQVWIQQDLIGCLWMYQARYVPSTRFTDKYSSNQVFSVSICSLHYSPSKTEDKLWQLGEPSKLETRGCSSTHGTRSCLQSSKSSSLTLGPSRELGEWPGCRASAHRARMERQEAGPCWRRQLLTGTQRGEIMP